MSGGVTAGGASLAAEGAGVREGLGSAVRASVGPAARAVAGAAGGATPSRGQGDGTVTRAAARALLGLAPGEFRLALELGEIHAEPGGGEGWGRGLAGDCRIALPEVERLLTEPDFPHGLRRRIADVGAGGGAALLGVTAHHFGRLARRGAFRPVRWYVNRYRVVVWRFLVAELEAFAASMVDAAQGRPRTPLPGQGVLDLRARGWRARRVEQLLRGTAEPWRRAAVWAALAGTDSAPGAGAGDASPEVAAGRAMAGLGMERPGAEGREMEGAGAIGLPPTPHEATYLRRLLPSLHGVGGGWHAAPGVKALLCTAQDADEVAEARLGLAEALALARSVSPAPECVPPGAAADALRCAVSALPRAYRDEPVPRDLLDRWCETPPAWLRRARAEAGTVVVGVSGAGV